MQSTIGRAATRCAATAVAVLALLGTSIGVPAHAFTGATVTGRVTDSAGSAVAGMQVEAFSLVDGEWTRRTSTTTDSTGVYELQVQQAATYRVGAIPGSSASPYVDTYWTHAQSVEAGTDVVISTDGQTVPGIDIVMTKGGDITGRVTDKVGSPLAGVVVTAWTPYGSNFQISGQVLTASDGTYDLSRLTADTYRIDFHDNGSRFLYEAWDDAPDLASATPIVLGPEQLASGRDAVLTARSHITGRVTNSSGAPIPGIYVFPSKLSDGIWKEYDDAMTTDSNGVYDLAALSPGTYRLEFEDASSTYAIEYWDNAPTRYYATDIVVGKDVTVTGRNAVLNKPSEVFVNKEKPRVSGRFRVGGKVTAEPGSWTPGGATFSYQWMASGKPLAGATSATYTVGAAAVGRSLRVRVTASSPGLTSVSADSSGTKVGRGRIQVATRPQIRGIAKVGDTLKVTKGAWRPTRVHLHFQWYADGSRIKHASGRRLAVGASLAGHRIKVKVRAIAAGYAPRTVTSGSTAPVRHRAGTTGHLIRSAQPAPF